MLLYNLSQFKEISNNFNKEIKLAKKRIFRK